MPWVLIPWLPKFIVEARRRDGAYYPPETLYSICTGLNRVLGCVDRADVNDPRFVSFKETLDSQVKQLKATGHYKRNKAEVITADTKIYFGRRGFWVITVLEHL